MLDEPCWMTSTNVINFHPTFLQHLSNILDKMLDRFNYALSKQFWTKQYKQILGIKQK